MKRSIFLNLLLGFTLSATSHAAIAPFMTGSGKDVSFRSFEDDAGGFYLVWAESKSDKNNQLLAQHVNAKGQNLWDAAGLKVTTQLDSVTDWDGLSDGQQGLVLFWDESDGVHAQRFFPDGTRRRPGNSVRMSTSTAMQPDAVPDATGGTLMVWQQTLVDGRPVLMAQRLDSEGHPVWTPGGIRVSLRASKQTNPRVIYDNMSGMIVAWRDEANDASELRIQRIDFQGNRLWSLEGLKITAPMGSGEFPRLAPIGTGEVVLAWNASDHQTNEIFLQKVGPEPKLKWGTMKLASSNPILYNRWNPVVIGDEKGGGAWIGWEDFRNQTNYQIQINHLDLNGKSLFTLGERSAAPADGDQGKLAITSNGRGGIFAGWIDNRLSTVGLYVQEIDVTGKLAQGPKGYLVMDRIKKPSVPQWVTVGPGKAVLSWVDRPKKDTWQLYWTFVSSPSAQP